MSFNPRGIDMHDAELDELLAQEEYDREMRKEPWTIGQIALLVFDVLIWWAIICFAWKVWPR